MCSAPDQRISGRNITSANVGAGSDGAPVANFMPPRSRKAAKASNTNAKVEVQDVGIEATPSKHVSVPVYISVIGVHATLLAFAGLFLPRATFLQDLARYNEQTAFVSSQDRPQHPFLEDLTRSPTVTLFSLCLGALLIQTYWALWLKRTLIDIRSHASPEDRMKEKYPPVAQRAKDLAQAYGVVILASIVFHFIMVLFGAPITSLVGKTYLLALFVSILSILAPAYILGTPTWSDDSTSLVKRWTWVRLFAEFSPRNTIERALVYPLLGATLGAWVGIVPIALDWDRPWQAWPLTPAYGALAGHIISSITAVTVDAIVAQKSI